MKRELPTDVVLHYAMQLAEAVDKNMKESLGPELAGIIKQHAILGAGAGLIPIPYVDIAAITANVWTMYVGINKAIGMPFGENIAKSIAGAIATNVLSFLPGLVFTKIGDGLLKATGFGTAAGMILDAATDYAVVLVMGIIYFKALTILLSKKEPLTNENLHKAVEEAGQDKHFIKDTFHNSKKQYKEEDPKTKAAGSGS